MCFKAFWIAWLVASIPLVAQTTQGLITGRVVHAENETAAVERARVNYSNIQSGVSGAVWADEQGFYTLAYLSPGSYRVRAEGDGCRPREIQMLELAVGARLEINFPLGPLGAVAETVGQAQPVVPVLGPDLEMGRAAALDLFSVSSETRQSAINYVVDPKQVAEAPLSSRNVYAMLAMLPGFTATQTTGRGLQISSSGQRPSASNYLLDGLENNDYLNTGPYVPTPPESIQEYRISTNDDSAEYGNPGGFVANAVTRGGTSAYHAQLYGYFGNEALNANTYQNNAGVIPRPRQPYKRLNAGYWAGGPVLPNVLFASSSLEQLRSRSRLNHTSDLLVPSRIDDCAGAAASKSSIVALFHQFPLATLGTPLSSALPSCSATGLVPSTAPVFVDRTFLMERLDYRSPRGADRLTGTVLVSNTPQPQHYWSPYVGMDAPLSRDATGIALTYVHALTPGSFNELRSGWRDGKIESIPPHPEIPFLRIFDSGPLRTIYSLPSQHDPVQFGMKENNWELGDTLLIARGRHALTAGGSMLLRRPQYLLGFLGSGMYVFTNGARDLQALAAGQASYYELPVSRASVQQKKPVAYGLPSYDRYRINQFSAFAQDNLRVSSRLAINAGVRYESFGALSNQTRPTGFFQPGQGNNFVERIIAADPGLEFAKRSVYRPDRNNWAGRFGVSYSAPRRVVFRAGYGVFYERPYDNLVLTQRNSFEMAAFCFEPDCANVPVDVTHPITSIAPGSELHTLPLSSIVQSLRSPVDWVNNFNQVEKLWVDEKLRTPYVQNWAFSTQYQVTGRLSLEVSHMGSGARKLVSNDVVNRACSFRCGLDIFGNFVPGRLNDRLPGEILYRSNSGGSSYAALGATARFRGSRSQFQISYTWSHSIDNQSDALVSDLFNLAATNLDAIGIARSFGTFTRQFDSRADRGNSDFDVRHSLVFYSIWELPGPTRGVLTRLFRGWRVAELASVQAGLPFTVYAAPFYPAGTINLPANGGGFLIGQRLNFSGDPMLAQPLPISRPSQEASWDGAQLVDLSKAWIPSGDQIGTLGRNALRAPMVWNADVSVARSVGLPSLRDTAKVELRAEATNFFNHASLNPPDMTGVAIYGPNQLQTSFPAAVPLFASPRRVQVQVKLSF